MIRMTDQKIEGLLRLPWTICPYTSLEGDRLLRVAEVPSAVGSGTDDTEIEQDLWESLRASLAACLHFNDPIPLPDGCSLPWLTPGAHAGTGCTARYSTLVVLRYADE